MPGRKPHLRDPDSGDRPSPEEREDQGVNTPAYDTPEKGPSLTKQLAKARLSRIRKQNRKLDLELKSRQGGLVDFAEIRKEVLQANTSVKQQIFAVIERANLPFESKLTLKKEMTRALNDL